MKILKLIIVLEYKKTLYSLKYIFNSDISKIYDFTISDRILVELSKIADKYFDKCIY